MGLGSKTQAKESESIMNKQIKRLLEPGVRLFFVVLFIYAGVSFYFSIAIGIAEAAGLLVLFFVYRLINKRRNRELTKYMDQMMTHVDTAAKDNIVNFPLPMSIIRLDSGTILWSNSNFIKITDGREHYFDRNITSFVPGFDFKWLFEGKNQGPSIISLNDRYYAVMGNIIHNDGDGAPLANLLWIDRTEEMGLLRERAFTKPVVSIIMIDNYDEAFKNLPDSQKSGILAAVDERVGSWTIGTGGICRKFERDKYLFIFEAGWLEGFADEKFSLLDKIRGITGAGGVPVTVSIGIGKDAKNYLEGMSFAQLALDMSLSRGGDQAVIKSKAGFDFYGGHSKELEKRTKVKSRIMSNTLRRLISDSSSVIVMSHKSCDLDSVGSAAGIISIARKLGKSAWFVIDMEKTEAKGLVVKLKAHPQYKDTFINVQDAMLAADYNTLLVVVDTNRPELVENASLLESINKVAVVDHHRRSATYIDRAVLNFHEPYASSASELVTELLQYICEPGDLLRCEAEALLSGIVLDSKNFTLHTGVRTFEAAMFLKSAGADTIEVRKLFQTDLSSSVARSGIIRSVRVLRRSIAVSAVSEDVGRTTAARAADEILDIAGVTASFVMFPSDGRIILSARSLGDINVQVICEKLGGGGHQLIAGAQLDGIALEDALNKLKTAVNIYFDENGLD